MAWKWLEEWRGRKAAKRKEKHDAWLIETHNTPAECEERRVAAAAASAERKQREQVAEALRVRGEIEKAIAKGERFIELARGNEYWRAAVRAYASANERVTSVSFYGYEIPEYGRKVLPEFALLTMAKSQS